MTETLFFYKATYGK